MEGFYSSSESDKQFLYNALVYCGATRWLTCDPTSGIVPVSSFLELELTFDATGMYGGDYYANIVVASNDPDEPEVIVPACLHVTGAPDIAIKPDSLDYDSVFISASVTDTLMVSNAGTDLLTVKEILSDHPNYTVTPDSFSLAPQEKQNVLITFSPSDTGLILGTLTIKSNDPKEDSILTVNLRGVGLIPPDIVVYPDSLKDSLFTGDTSIQFFTIRNDGGSNLLFEVGIESVESLKVLAQECMRGITRTGEEVIDGRIVSTFTATELEQFKQNLQRYYQGVESLLAGRDLPTIAVAGSGTSDMMYYLLNDTSLASRYVFYEVYDNYNYDLIKDYDGLILCEYDVGISYDEAVALNTYYQSGKPVLMGMDDLDDEPSNVQTQVFPVFGISGAYDGVYYWGSLNPDNPITEGIGQVYAFADGDNDWYTLGGADWIFAGTDGNHYGVSYEGEGKTVVMGENLAYVWSVGNSSLIRNAINWMMEGVGWLSVFPESGVVPAGDSMQIQVTFNAEGLYGGDYLADLVVLSNDPDESEVTIPANLHVTGAPDIEIKPDSLNYDSVFISASVTDTLMVSNAGTDLLTVKEILSDHPNYTVNPDSFSLSPEEKETVLVTFSPSDTGLILGTLTIKSNDPKEDSILTVNLRGVGLIPPDISVSPDSLQDSLFTGDTSTQVLTIFNTIGGSDLVFDISIGESKASSSRIITVKPAPVTIQNLESNLESTYPPLSIWEANGMDESFYNRQLKEYLDRKDQDKTSSQPFSVSAVNPTTSMAPSTSKLIEDFDTTAIWPWAPWITVLPGGNVASTCAHDGPQGIVDPDWHYRTDVTVGFPEENLSVWVKPVTDDSRFYMGFGATALGAWSLVAAPNTGELIIQENYNYLFYNLASVPQSWLLNTWYKLEVTFEESGQVTGRLYASDGSTLLNTVSTTLTGFQPAGVAIRSFDDFCGDSFGKGKLLSWLSAIPESGTIPPSSSMNIEVTFDATGMYGGDYHANILISSNDPDEPVVTVPAYLHVTGAPDIAVTPDSLNYDSVFIGVSVTDTVIVSNEGTDLLSVKEILSDHPNYTANLDSFSLSPEEKETVLVTFSPSDTGLILGTLTIKSNDPQEDSILTVYLQGVGLIPPDIVVYPDSLRDSLFTGDTSTQVLTISNSGVSDLIFEISIGATSVASMPMPVHATSFDRGLNDRLPANNKMNPIPSATRFYGMSEKGTQDQWVDYRSYGQIKKEGVKTSVIPNPVTRVLPIVIDDPAGDGGAIDVTIVRGISASDTLWIGMECTTVINPSTFGGFLSLDIDQNPNTGLPPSYGNANQDIGVEYEFWFFSLDYGFVQLYNKVSGSFIGSYPAEIESNTLYFSAPLSDIGNDDGTMDVTGVVGDTGPTDWFPDSGHGTIKGTSWLSANPTSGIVSAGNSMDITVAFDATGMYGGDYHANILISSNDPDEPMVTVPAYLHVTGAPDIAVTPDSLNYDSVFIGVSVTDTVIVSNEGTDLLSVREILSDHPNYTVNPDSFSLSPEEKETVLVSFSPSDTGLILGTLTIKSNDPQEDSILTVYLRGVGLIPPDISVSPDSLQDSLFTGDTSTQIMTIYNTTGGSNLTFDISIEGADKNSVSFKVRTSSLLQKTRRSESLINQLSSSYSNPYSDISEVRGKAPSRIIPFKGEATSSSGALFDVDASNKSIIELNPMTGAVINSFGLPETASVGPEGLAFDGKYLYYVNSYGTNTIYRLNRTTGQIMGTAYVSGLGSIDALGHSGEAVYALAYGSSTIYKIDFETASIIDQFTFGFGLGGGMTFGGSRGTIFVSEFSSLIYEIDPSTWQVVNSFSPPFGGTVYGLGYSQGLGVLFVSNVSDGTLYAVNPDNGSIIFSYPIPYGTAIAADEASGIGWLSTDPASGSIPAGSSLDIQVTFDAKGMYGADYNANIVISSNDPDEPLLTVPVHLHVTGAPDIAVTPDSLDYDSVFIGVSVIDTVLVSNEGTDLLSVREILSDHPNYTVNPDSFSLSPEEKETVLVTFSPSDTGLILGTLTIKSNDPQEDSILTVYLRGIGVIPPEIVVYPDSLQDSLFTGDTSIQFLTIRNDGGSNLLFEVGIEPVESLKVLAQECMRRITRTGEMVIDGQSISTFNVSELEQFKQNLERYYQGVKNLPNRDDLPTIAVVGGGTWDIMNYIMQDTSLTNRYAFNGVYDYYDISFIMAYDGLIISEWGSYIDFAEAVVVNTYYQSGKPVLMGMDDLDDEPSNVQTLVFPIFGISGAYDGDYYWGSLNPDNPITEGISQVYSFAGDNDWYNLSGADWIFAGTDGNHYGVSYEGEGRTALMGENLADIWIVGNGPLIRNAINWMMESARWLSVFPESGIVPVDDSVQIQVNFNAEGMYGGDYDANIVVSSNDPDEPVVTVPAYLHVTGAPDIAVTPDSLDYDSVFIGVSVTDTVIVSNEGTDLLSVKEILSDHPNYTVNLDSFSLSPEEKETVFVTFSPSDTGLILGILTIKSNDPQEDSILTVYLRGVGLIPPDISVSPDSLQDSLFTGDTSSQLLTISNTTGGSDLVFDISIEGLRVAAVSPLRISTAENALLNQPPPYSHSQPFGDKNSDEGKFASLDTEKMQGVVKSERSNLSSSRTKGVALIAITNATDYYVEIYENPQIETTLTNLGYDYIYIGNVSEAEMAGADAIFGRFGGIDLSYPELTAWIESGHGYIQTGDWIYWFPNYFAGTGSSPIMINILDSNHPITKGLPAYWSAYGFWHYVGGGFIGWVTDTVFSNLGQGIVSGNTYDRVITADQVGDGYAVYLGFNIYGSEAGANSVQLFANALRWVTGGADWLSAKPNSGTVPAGSSMDIAITFDATGMYGGDYNANILISSNDPDEPMVTVPAYLHVTGAPDIAVTPDSLDYDSVFIGVSVTNTMIVSNEGTDLLSVREILSDHPNYTMNPDSFSLAPKEKQEVLVTFSPSDTGLILGTLTIKSNDPQADSILTVYLRGIGVVPPEIVVYPDSLSDSLFTGDTSVQFLTIRNDGGSNLFFEVGIEPVESLKALAGECMRGITRTERMVIDGQSIPTFNASELEQFKTNLTRFYQEGKGLSGWSDLPTIAVVGDCTWDLMYYLMLDTSLVNRYVFYGVYNYYDTSLIRDYDGLIVCEYGNGIYYDEAVSLNVFYQSGKPVLLGMCYLGYAANEVKALIYPVFGISGATLGDYYWGSLNPDNPITRGISQVYYFYGYDDWYTPTGADWIFAGTDGNYYGVSYEGEGRTVAMGDNLAAIWDAGNGPLIRNAIDWMMEGVGWLSVFPKSGVVPAGDSMQIQVTFNAEGMYGGDYDANVLISNNDPDESEVTIPTHLHVTGAPDIAVTPDSLDYDSVFIGVSVTDTVIVSNEGTDLLSVREILSDHPNYTANLDSFSLSPEEKETVFVTFAPTAEGEILGILTIKSNDPSDSIVTVFLRGKGLEPPDISVSPDSLNEDLFTGQTSIQKLTIANKAIAGASDLTWEISTRFTTNYGVVGSSPEFPSSHIQTGKKELPAPPPGRPDPDKIYSFSPFPRSSSTDLTSSLLLSKPSSTSLEDILQNLNENFDTVISVIPQRFDFSEGEVGYYIVDGGSDMYDDGNYLYTNLGGYIYYSDNAIVSSSYLGIGGRYFTRKYPGLFVLAADMQGVDYFEILGGLGADGGGNLDGAILQTQVQGITFYGFVKRVYNAGDPSVNHLIIIEENPETNHEFSTSTNDDYHRVFSLSGSERVYYLLYAGSNGFYVDNQATLDIMNTFLSVIGLFPEWISVNPTSGIVPVGESVGVDVTFDATGLNGGDYDANVVVSSNDPDEPEVIVPAHLHVTGAPDIVVSDSSLDYNSVFMGLSVTDTLIVSNQGTELLMVNDVISSHTDYTVDADSFSLAPGDSQNVLVTFAPSSAGEILGTLTIKSNDPDDSTVTVFLRGEGIEPPVITVAPDSLGDSLYTDETSTQVLTISNQGGTDLSFGILSQAKNVPPLAVSAHFTHILKEGETKLIHRALPMEARYLPPPAKVSTSDPTLNETNPWDGPLEVAGEYGGDYLHFGISEYGEIMPFQYPLGNEHLALGFWLSGYTVAYLVNDIDQVCYAAYGYRYGLVPVTFIELVYDSSHVVVEVVTRTSDGRLEINQLFTFDRKDKYINIQTRLENVSGSQLDAVVLKSFADWDVDGSSANNWDYDLTRNMVYAYVNHYTAIAGTQIPDLMDVHGWNDYYVRATTVEFPTGPVYGYDGLGILHYELGNLSAGASTDIATAYGAGDDLADLQGVIDRGLWSIDWLSADPTFGTIPGHSSLDITVSFDATSLPASDYAANLMIYSNDPFHPRVMVPVYLASLGGNIAPFSLLYPPNKAYTLRKVRFDWESTTVVPDSFNQIRYDLYVSTSYSFPPDSTVIDSNLIDSEYRKTLDYGIYYWKVKAKDDLGGEKWCDHVRYFMVTGIPYVPGDFDGDGDIDVGDIIFAINYLFRSGPAPDPLERGDANCDQAVNIGDVIFLINYLFRNGPSPGC